MPNGVVVLSLSGDAGGESQKIASELRSAAADPARVIVVDLRELASIDASVCDVLERVVTREEKQARYLVMTPRSGELRDSLHRMRRLRDARSCILI